MLEQTVHPSARPKGGAISQVQCNLQVLLDLEAPALAVATPGDQRRDIEAATVGFLDGYRETLRIPRWRNQEAGYRLRTCFVLDWIPVSSVDVEGRGLPSLKAYRAR